jgi:hypothetical protein
MKKSIRLYNEKSRTVIDGAGLLQKAGRVWLG